MKAIASCLASIVGENAVWNQENIEGGQKERILKAIPGTQNSCIVYPQTQEQLAQVIAEASRNNWHVLTCGSGSKLDWGGLVKDIDIVVSTERINQLIDHAVGDLTVTVEAGMKFSHLQEILVKTNQFLALDPVVPESATIGGIVATGDTGSLRQRYNGVRDQLLGITIIRADGQIAKAGGRVVKNVAGYDLMKLFTGSYGTLGAISQVTFRLYPMQELSETVVLTGKADAVSQAAEILRSSALTPTQADLLSSQLVSGLDLGNGLGLAVRFQSIAQSVKEQSQRLLGVGQNLGLVGVLYATDDETRLWQKLREEMFSDGTSVGITCKIGVLPTAGVEVLSAGFRGLIHISSGLGWLRFEDEVGVLKMRSHLEGYGGFLSILSAPVEVKERLDVWGYSGNALQLMKGIKEQFDGKNILSRGRFVGGI